MIERVDDPEIGLSIDPQPVQGAASSFAKYEQMKHERQRELDDAALTSAESTAATRDGIAEMLRMQIEGEAREARMAFWTRIAAVCAIASVLISLAALLVAAGTK